MKKNSKKLFLNNTAIETRRTTSKTAGGGLANYAIELGQWIENRIKDNTIKVGEQHVVDDIATRDDLFDVTKGDVAYVVDASADANVGSGAALYVYDGSDWKRIAKFESLNVTSSNITEGTLNPATSNRTVDMGSFDLSIEGVGINELTLSNSIFKLSHNFTLEAGNIVDNNDFNKLKTTPSYTALQSKGASGNCQISVNNSGQVALYSLNRSYRIGIDNTTIPPVFSSSTAPYMLSLNANDGIMYGLTSSSYFISDSSLSPASSGAPTFTEVETYVNGLGAAVIASLKNRVLYYTGTDTSTDAYTYSYYFSGDGRLFVLDKPKEVELDFFALTVTSGSASLTAVDNGITSNLFYPAGYSNSDIVGNFAISWDNTNSSAGQFTAQLKANDGTIITTLTAPDNTFGGTFGNSTTTPLLNVRKGLYVEFSNITGTVKSPVLKFTITRV